MNEQRFYASRRRHRDEPETWDKPWTVRDRRTGAWYGAYPTKDLAQRSADGMAERETPSPITTDGEAAELATFIGNLRATLFATAADLGAPPVAHGDADLSRIRVLDRESPEGQEELRKRAERKAKHDRIEGRFGMTELGSL